MRECAVQTHRARESPRASAVCHALVLTSTPCFRLIGPSTLYLSGNVFTDPPCHISRFPKPFSRPAPLDALRRAALSPPEVSSLMPPLEIVAEMKQVYASGLSAVWRGQFVTSYARKRQQRKVRRSYVHSAWQGRISRCRKNSMQSMSPMESSTLALMCTRRQVSADMRLDPRVHRRLISLCTRPPIRLLRPLAPVDTEVLRAPEYDWKSYGLRPPFVRQLEADGVPQRRTWAARLLRSRVWGPCTRYELWATVAGLCTCHVFFQVAGV